MSYVFDRDTSDEHRLMPDQPQWEATTSNGTTITFEFVNNSFRKHFALPSKKETPTDQTTKAKHKLEKRLLLAPQARRADLIDNSGQRKLKKRYGDLATTLHVVDLKSVNLKTVLNSMAEQLLEAKPKHTTGDFTFTFKTQCVFEFKGSVDELNKQLTIGEPNRISSISLHVFLRAPNSYRIG